MVGLKFAFFISKIIVDCIKTNINKSFVWKMLCMWIKRRGKKFYFPLYRMNIILLLLRLSFFFLLFVCNFNEIIAKLHGKIFWTFQNIHFVVVCSLYINFNLIESFIQHPFKHCLLIVLKNLLLMINDCYICSSYRLTKNNVIGLHE